MCSSDLYFFKGQVKTFLVFPKFPVPSRRLFRKDAPRQKKSRAGKIQPGSKNRKELLFYIGRRLSAGSIAEHEAVENRVAADAVSAVDAAGNSMKRVWDVIWLPVPYSWYERMKQEIVHYEGILRDTQFGADVELEVLTPQGRTKEFLDRVVDISAGTLEGMITAQEYRAFPIDES